MLDVILVAAALGFFALSIGYTMGAAVGASAATGKRAVAFVDPVSTRAPSGLKTTEVTTEM